MENQLQIFESAEFGQVRTIEENGKILFIASDIVKALGYANTSKAVNDHCRCVTKRYIPHPQGKSTLEVNVISKGDIYRLIAHSKLPAAEKFEGWVFDEVLPTIRKTGSYGLDEKQNAKTKQAKVIAELAKTSKLPTHQNALIATAAKVVTGEEVIALPTSESGRERHPLGWYCKFFNKKETWATYLGKMLKKQGIEKIHGKTGELIEFVDDNNNQRQGFEWYSDYLLPIVKNMAEVS